MTEVVIDIVRFVYADQPGFVECSITDAWDRRHLFIEKVPVVTNEHLTENSLYPQSGTIGCRVLRRWRDPEGREIATVDTINHEEQTQFDVLVSKLIDI